MVKSKDLEELVTEQLSPLHESEVEKAKKVDQLVRGGTTDRRPIKRNNVVSDKLKLEGLAHTSLLDLIVEYASQQIVAEGFTVPTGEAPQMWLPFERNGIPSRQGALWRATLAYGQAYGLALPGSTNPLMQDSTAYMRAFSPKRFGAVYQDEIDDEFPMYAYRVIPQKGSKQLWRVYDDEFEHHISYEDGVFKHLESRAHNMGVCPVVRFTEGADLEGNVLGQPARYERDAARHDKTVHDRLQIQHYNSWRVKTATKLDSSLSEQERKEFKLKLEQDDILVADGEAEFGTLDQTDLSPMAKAQEMDRDTLAAVSQTPVWAFNGGSMVNLSADALVEAKSGNRQKVWTIHRAQGRPLCAWARLAARAEGREKDAHRFDLAVEWADIGSQSLSAAADALGKVAIQLGVPVEKLWELLPGVSRRTVQGWKEYAEAHPSGDYAIAQALTRQVTTSGAQ